ncbi:hypothetical protein BDF19DRAFT_426075 [Syncephalis fuscata]|nr:hypothetical protein BDF19DRAFT_426075 [Syncephalis fuscata]
MPNNEQTDNAQSSSSSSVLIGNKADRQEEENATMSVDLQPQNTLSAITAQEQEILLQNEDALEVLHGQLKQAERDLECLVQSREQAFKDPAQFVLSLKEKKRESLPILQQIVSIPAIDLRKYGGSTSQLLDYFVDPTKSSEQFMTNAHKVSMTSFQKKEQVARPVRPPVEDASLLSAMVKRAVEALPSRGVSPESSSDEQESTEDISPRNSKRQRHSVGHSKYSFDNASRYLPAPTKLEHESRPQIDETGTAPSSDTLNVPWTDEELERLEQLLKIIPDEGVAAERYRRIAAVLGTRTDRQVASRVQRLLAKENYSTETPLNLVQSNYRVTGAMYLNLAPTVLMPDQGSVEDKLQSNEQSVTVHYGFSCDGCQLEPIIGTRWKCLECPESDQVDLCDTCHTLGEFENDIHNVDHRYEALTLPEPVDNTRMDTGYEDTGNDYAYLGLGTSK